VVQQTFLEAHRDFAQFRGGNASALRLWLHRLLRNNVANVNRYYRAARRGVRREQPFDAGDSLSAAGPGVAADTLSPSGHAVANEQAEALAQALERLPEDYRRVITLRHLQGLSFDEIGNQMNRSANAAQLLWMRAIERMQQEMGVSS
jgi:RNA polymerase sigma-70 factor (ECF subfamily)